MVQEQVGGEMSKHAHCDNCGKDLANDKNERNAVYDLNERFSVRVNAEVYHQQASPCWQPADLCFKCENAVLALYRKAAK